MKIDKIAGKECLSPDQVRSTVKRRVVLFAEFLPAETDVTLAATDLVAAAQVSGVDITSATLASDTFAQVSLSCRTPMHFQRAKESIAQMQLSAADHVVVLLDSFVRAEMRSTTRFRRLKERRRILFLLAEILRSRPDTILVASGGVARLYLGAARALSGRGAPVVRPVRDLLNGSLTRDIGLFQSALPPERRRALLERHSGISLGLRRLTAQSLLSQASKDGHEEDLRFLIGIASSAALRSHPTIRWLRSAAPGNSDIHECPPPHRLLQKAQEPAPQAARFNLPITRYMMHLHTVLQLEREFPLTTRSQAQTYLDWYRKRCFERVPARWIPCPPAPKEGSEDTSGRAGTREDSAERIVLKLLASNLPQGDTDTDTEMMTYLAGDPTGNSLPRLAIVLAVLCQIPIRLPDDGSVWASPAIRKWFEDTACRLMPSCRRFAPVAKSPVRPLNTLTIYGMADGRTGLGANAIMARSMAEEMGVPFTLRDIEGTEPAPNPLSAAGSRRALKRNIALHHVNADRIPLQIMSRELARRNDTYHIGFLLWELDRIPQAHRLGLDLLDEIWAPSRFVADLYAAETSKPVHLVKKGLAELGRLQRLSAVSQDDAGRFTAMICFDFHSSVERKNPLASVRAFQIAFPQHSHDDCRLIVKTTPTRRDHWGDPADQLGQIRKLAEKDSRIQIVEAFVSQPELWRMMNSASCMLSTHRAEGFGYIPAYALALAKPLVTTDYGGSQDFCTPRTSFPVAAGLVDVPKDHALYSPEGAKWADVSPEAVAASLRRIYDDHAMAAARARCGQELLMREYSMAAYAARCRHRLEQIGAL